MDGGVGVAGHRQASSTRAHRLARRRAKPQALDRADRVARDNRRRVGTLVATIVEVALLSGPYITRTLALEWRSLLSAVFVPVLVPVLPSAAVAVALTRLLDPASLVSLLGICALAGAAYVGTYLSFGATASERVLAGRGRRALTRRLRLAR